jgi:hypothetical protein
MNKLRSLFAAWLFFVLAVAVFAQDIPALTETYTDPTSGITVNFPSDWEVPAGGATNDGVIPLTYTPQPLENLNAIQPGEMGIEIIPPLTMDPLLGGMDFENAWVTLANQMSADADDFVDVTEYASHGRFHTLQIEQYSLTVGLIELQEGTFALMLASNHPDRSDEVLPLFYAIGGNLTLTETVANTLFAKTQAFQDEASTFEFQYSAAEDWAAYEEEGIGVASNAGRIEDFTGEAGQFLIVVSAVPASDADESALMAGMLMGVAQNMVVAMPPMLMKPDGAEVETLGKLEGLEGKSLGDDFWSATAIVGQPGTLPALSISTDNQSSQLIETNAELVAIVVVYGAAGEEETIDQILQLVASSLRVPVNLSAITPSDIPLTETIVNAPLVVHHPADWETFVRGGFNVVGATPEMADAMRLIMSARRLEAGETAEEALHSFLELFGYEVFDSIELTDGRTAYIGTPFTLGEAVLAVEYGDGIVITMSYLPNNPDDFMIGLPIALAILEGVEIQ